MYTLLIACSLILVIIAAIATIFAIRQEERKMDHYKEQHLSVKEARERSLEYEQSSVSSVVPVQFWTYIIATIVTIVLIIVFAIYY